VLCLPRFDQAAEHGLIVAVADAVQQLSVGGVDGRITQSRRVGSKTQFAG
jgi:hypothetical protein